MLLYSTHIHYIKMFYCFLCRCCVATVAEIRIVTREYARIVEIVTLSAEVHRKNPFLSVELLNKFMQVESMSMLCVLYALSFRLIFFFSFVYLFSFHFIIVIHQRTSGYVTIRTERDRDRKGAKLYFLFSLLLSQVLLLSV